MKTRLVSLCIGCLLLLVAGCTKFDPATVEAKVIPVTTSNQCIMDCEGTITNNGGCKYFNEVGFLFSLNPDPTYKGEEVTTIMMEDHDGKSTTFDVVYNAPLLDTIYYVRAYVCTNAGTGYSESEIVSTYTSAE
ncbi:MAG: hypothetical protein II757_01955 [Bacteroidales bacterium]|jgi:hypothetical protein|nr:hypothetical protein [Bacteroidales bacterium]MCR5114272.1 hypothetical protein [Bacteroidales bacterium]